MGKLDDPKLMKKTISNWYNVVNLWKIFRIHRLVAMHFIPNPDNLPCVCHKIESIPAIDNVDNLFWGTQKDNISDMIKKWRSGTLWIMWELHKQSKKVRQIKDWNVIKEWESIWTIKRELWIDHISECCKWKRNTSWWFKWEYV